MQKDVGKGKEEMHRAIHNVSICEDSLGLHRTDDNPHTLQTEGF